MKKCMMLAVFTPLFLSAGGDITTSAISSAALPRKQSYIKQLDDATTKNTAAKKAAVKSNPTQNHKFSLLAFFKCCCRKMEKD